MTRCQTLKVMMDPDYSLVGSVKFVTLLGSWLVDATDLACSTSGKHNHGLCMY